MKAPGGSGLHGRWYRPPFGGGSGLLWLEVPPALPFFFFSLFPLFLFLLLLFFSLSSSFSLAPSEWLLLSGSLTKLVPSNTMNIDMR
jgi:hypothetical protein